jgi:hypothetical protein
MYDSTVTDTRIDCVCDRSFMCVRQCLYVHVGVSSIVYERLTIHRTQTYYTICDTSIQVTVSVL